jgi:hypothetical protein
VEKAIRQATALRSRQGRPIGGRAIHHSDAGSQYTSVRFAETLMLAGLAASVGSVGDAYDNALAETTIGLYKTECTRDGSPFRTGPIATLADLEECTSAWVHWYNTQRLMHRLGRRPPAEAEAEHYQAVTVPGRAARHWDPRGGPPAGPAGQADQDPGPPPGQGYGPPPHVKPHSATLTTAARHPAPLPAQNQVCTKHGTLQVHSHWIGAYGETGAKQDSGGAGADAYQPRRGDVHSSKRA